ncbi:MAG: alkaline phosphatase family protein [Euryarchaeota archaeon]|nr:alkaline phosphatase family protein [Euryarchaeota archaeon]
MTAKPRPKQTTLMLILDACRSDYFTSGEMPYIEKLQKESLHGEGESPPGFAQRTTMFTGTYPDTSQNFSAFGYSPENSPFKWLNKMGPLRHLYLPHAWMIPARMAIRTITKKVTGNFHTDPAWIRGSFLPFFEVVEDTRPIFDEGALPFTSVFDLCRQYNKEFFYGAHPVSGDDEEIYKMLLERIHRRDETELYIGQFSALDEGGHPHGPYLPPDWEQAPDQSKKDVDHMRSALHEIDRKVRTLHEALLENYEKVNILILGDHGMAPVRRRVNVLKDVQKATGAKPGKDFVLFLDSTYAKFWFHDKETERKIMEHLATVDYGHIIDDAEARHHRIKFDHRRYGDMMFAADVGVLFWPDYFHIMERPIKGMHGYIDKDEETYGALLLHGPGLGSDDIGRRILVDIFPTLCDLVGLPTTPHNEGRSMVGEEKVREVEVHPRH